MDTPPSVTTSVTAEKKTGDEVASSSLVVTNKKPENTVKPVHIDGALYCAIGFLTALLVCLDSDKAVKLIAPATLWWVQTIAESLNGGLLALKMFRSTSYSDSKDPTK